MGSVYNSLVENLMQFYELGQLPFQLERLDEGLGIDVTMVTNNARYHHSSMLKYNKTKLRRAEERALRRDSEDLEVSATCKHSRSRSIDCVVKDLCFFCEQPLGDTGQQHLR